MRSADRDTTREARPPAWLGRYLRTLGIEYGEPHGIRRGTQSACYMVECRQTRAKIAVKIFNDNSASAAAGEEFAALEILHEALSDQPGVSAPRPLGLIPSQLGAGYVMSAVEGVSLDAYLKRNPLPATPDMARTISRAVAAYHAAAGRPYGDFHSGNVLVCDDSSGMVLIDPSSPSGRHTSVEESLDRKLAANSLPDRLMAIDAGYWFYSVVIRMVRGDLRSIGEIRKQMALAIGLIDSIGTPKGRAMGVQAALEHLRFPRPHRSIRARILNLLTAGVLRAIATYVGLARRPARSSGDSES